MKPCRKQPFGASSGYARTASASRPAFPAEDNVRRYVHPIRTSKPPARSPVEETLGYVLEALSRQSEQLGEILRRLEGDNPDTM